MNQKSSNINLNGTGFRVVFVTLTVVFGLLLVLSVYFVQQEHDSRVQLDLETRAAEVARSTAETLRLSVENLHAASSILIYLQDISYLQFTDLTGRYFETDPGLLIMEWQPVVPGSRREEFEQKARNLGLLGFRFWQPNEKGEQVEVPFRPEHVPVYLMRSRYPEADDINTLGLDLAWSPERMASKWQARDQGRAESSGFFRVIMGSSESREPLGFAITLPIYRQGMIPDTEFGRRSQLLGYLAGVYSVPLLLEEQVTALQQEGISIEVFDHPDATERLLVESGKASQFEREIETVLFNNTWHIKLTATESFVEQRFDSFWYLLPVGVTALFAATMIFLSSQERSKNRLSEAHQALEEANRQLKELAQHDPLTGLLNRRAFFDRMALTLGELERHPRPTALLMIDLDWFKSINDQWGHNTGDRVLKAFAETCLTVSRKIDAVGRLGGEEFAILLPHTGQAEALGFAERLRETLSQQQVRIEQSDEMVSFTVSIGLSVISQSTAAEAWMAEADSALYAAKAAGRNQVAEYNSADKIRQPDREP